MKIRTVLVGVELQPDHPKTSVIHKVGGYGSGSDISRRLYALADIWDGGHARPTSFPTKLCGIRQNQATVRATAGTVALTTANDVFLDTVQRGPKVFGSVSITSWTKEHGGTYRGFREVFPTISRVAIRNLRRNYPLA
jgi:hypothetical protein